MGGHREGAERVEMMILRPQHNLSEEEAANLRRAWELACQGTALEGKRAVVLDGVDVEFVRA